MTLRPSLLLVSLLSLFFVVGCTGSSAPVATETSSTKLLSDEDYTMQVFSSWNDVASTDLDTTIAASKVRVMQSLQPIKGIYSKVSIIKEDLLTPTTSLAFADQNILNTPKITQNYTRLQTMEMTIAGERTVLHIYEGQSTALSPQLLFLQTFVVKGGTKGLTITFSISPSVKDTGPYIELLKTLSWPKTGA